LIGIIFVLSGAKDNYGITLENSKMANQIAFTAHIKVVPNRGPSSDTSGSIYKEQGHVRRAARFDYVRDLQRLAVLVYEELEANEPVRITLPKPGGGQFRTFGSHSSMQYGTGVKPQIGNQPALLMIEGFFRAPEASSALLVQPNPRMPVIHGGSYIEGFNGQWPHDPNGLPNTDVEAEVVELKQAIEAAISAISDESGVVLGLFRLQYKSATWGDGGHHFPRP